MRQSASLRLTLMIAAAILVVSVIGLSVQYVLVKRDLEARQLALVNADLAGFEALYDQRRVIAVRQAIEYRLPAGEDGALLLALEDRGGTTLAGNARPWPDGLEKPTEGKSIAATRFTYEDRTYLGVARSLPGGFPLLVARATGGVEKMLARLRVIIAAVVGGASILALALGHVFSRWVMRRIERMNQLADRVASGDLSARLTGARTTDEFGLLESHFHTMLDRIEALNRATHHLSDNIAHELRSPLTRIESGLTRLEDQGSNVDELRARIRNTVRIFDSLLEIASAEAASGSGTGLRPLDLAQIACEVYELYEPVAEDKGISFACDAPLGAAILGDRNLVAQLISNLVDNALKFTPTGENVRLEVIQDKDRHTLKIADTGPGLPSEASRDIFERFARFRGDKQVAGHGLGLALVKAIAVRHGARLRIVPGQKGFCIECFWPNVEDTG
ncbi:MAG: HAMP domain-containing protein [Rhodobacteraceae bacterium]|nr:HAMP domain-containing protein [Paracoccaceae bacterium]